MHPCRMKVLIYLNWKFSKEEQALVINYEINRVNLDFFILFNYTIVTLYYF